MKLITCIHLGVMSLIARDSFFALSLCFLAMMIAIILGLLLFIQFLHHRSKSDLEALRNRLAADLHDDIGASLSQLSVLGEVLHCQLGNADPQIKATLTAVCRTSNEAMDAMSQIVWATNPQYDSLTNLISRMRRFASEILPAAGIEFSFQAPHLDLNLPLKSELRRHLFLIFKESLNNIVRHSGGSFASIEFRVKG